MIVTHVPHKFEYWAHEKGQEPKPEGIFKYTDAEDRSDAKTAAHKHAGLTEKEKEMKTYRVTNDHHNIATNVKASSTSHARQLATAQNKKFAHKATSAALSWTQESVIISFAEFLKESAEKGESVSRHNQNYADAYETATALHIHHMTGSKTNPDEAHQNRMASLHEKGRNAFDKLPQHLKVRVLGAAHKSATAYVGSLEKNHGIKAKDIAEVHHTSKGISHLVGHHVAQNEAPHDVVVKTKSGKMHGASLKATSGTTSNNSPSIVPGLSDIYNKGLKRVGLHDKSVKERKAVRTEPAMIDNARKTQHEAAEYHAKTFNAMKPSEQKAHVQHLIRHNPDTPIHLDYVNGQKGTSTPYEHLPHVAKTLAAKSFVAKREKGSNRVKIHAVYPDKSEHHIATVEHRYTHGPHVSPQVNATLSSIKE